MFAKLYGEDDDQVLVTIMRGDEGPEVKYTTEGDGVIFSAAFHYHDTEDGWSKAQHAFDGIGEHEARAAAKWLRQ